MLRKFLIGLLFPLSIYAVEISETYKVGATTLEFTGGADIDATVLGYEADVGNDLVTIGIGVDYLITDDIDDLVDVSVDLGFNITEDLEFSIGTGKVISIDDIEEIMDEGDDLMTYAISYDLTDNIAISYSYTDVDNIYESSIIGVNVSF